jgi:DNA-directed RNA polymerase sigma subunit (sigma70/sigma32)
MSDDSQVVDESLRVYLREIDRQYPPMSSEEELRQIDILRKNDADAEAAKQRLVGSNLRSVVLIAQRYANRGIHVLDLVQKGNEGLVLASKTFGPDNGFTFSAHVQPYIEVAIREAVEGGTTAS